MANDNPGMPLVQRRLRTARLKHADWKMPGETTAGNVVFAGIVAVTVGAVLLMSLAGAVEMTR